MSRVQSRGRDDTLAGNVETPTGKPVGRLIRSVALAVFRNSQGRVVGVQIFEVDARILPPRRRPAGFPARRLYSGWHR